MIKELKKNNNDLSTFSEASICRKGTRAFSLTFIQVICAIAVVMLHTNDAFWQFSAEESYWFSANIIQSVAYFGVPCFFMLSGITLLDYRERYTTKDYFRKRISKTVIPYIAWSLFGVLFLLATHRLSFDTLSIKWVVNGLLSTNGIINLYWFFQPLFCIYLCIPVFALIEREKKKIAAEYILIVSFAVNMLPPFLNQIMALGFQWPYSVSVASGYIFWIWAGYYLYNFPLNRRVKESIYLFAIIGLLMHLVGTYTLSMKAGEIIGLYKGYNNIPNALYSVGVFQFLMDLSQRIENNRWLKKLIIVLGDYTFSVYLMQWFILRMIEDHLEINWTSPFFRLFAPFPIVIIIVVITWFLRRIPGIKKTVP